jgi:hypothetical protein
VVRQLEAEEALQLAQAVRRAAADPVVPKVDSRLEATAVASFVRAVLPGAPAQAGRLAVRRSAVPPRRAAFRPSLLHAPLDDYPCWASKLSVRVAAARLGRL